MNERPAPTMQDVQVDTRNLYREETYTDLKVATLRKLCPVGTDGQPDPNRQPVFSAQTHVMTRMGPVPIEAPLEAASLDEAARKFPQAVQQAMERLVQEIEQRQREESKRIVVPGQEAMPGLGGGAIPQSSGGPIIQ